MAIATRIEEFLIDDNWVVHQKSSVSIDTYQNLVKRRGCIDMPHMKLSFSGGVMTEINVIRHLGNEAVVRTTTTWEK